MSNGAARRPKNSPAGCSGSDHTEASNIARHEARLEHPVIWIASSEMFRRHSGSNTPMGCSGSDQEADIRESGAGLGSQVRGAAGTAPFCFRRTGAGAISPDRSLRTSAEFLSTQSRNVPCQRKVGMSPFVVCLGMFDVSKSLTHSGSLAMRQKATAV